MKIVRRSYFKNKQESEAWFLDWAMRIKRLNNRNLESLQITTSLGKTQIWRAGNSESKNTLVIFPGFRTSPLFWDLDGGLDYLLKDNLVYLIETNGQPNNSEGNSPAIKSLDYGYWAKEVLDQLKIEKAFIAGASFGGLVAMKLAMVAPERIKAAFLLNSGGLQSLSLKWKNLYLNILPILSPNKKNLSKFLNGAVFCSPTHTLTEPAMKLIIEFELMALSKYKDKTEKPYFMKDELQKVTAPIYLFQGTNDILFPYGQSIVNAKKYLPNLNDVFIFENVGHGIETYKPALEKIAVLMQSSSH